MRSHTHSLCFFAFTVLFLFQSHITQAAHSHLHRRGNGYSGHFAHIDANAPNHRQNFFSFVSRPDIDAPRWDVKVYDKSAVSPGYWFAGPYTDPDQSHSGGGWVGPHIYDSDGELVWSGAPLLNGFDAFDFRVANVLGQDMLTMMYRRERALVLNGSYEIQKELTVAEIDDGDTSLNMHDVNFVENGTKALLLKTITKRTSKKISKVGGYDGKCKVRFYGFEELDAKTLEPLFTWSSEGVVGLDETFVTRKDSKKYCNSDMGWDYIHANAIDKFPDGDYLLSGRHCNTIYKISHKDGSIVWRLGGHNSDFKFDEDFSGQHDARVHYQNSTHTIISFLDNAEVPMAKPRKTHDFSRGFMISLRTDRKHKTAEVIKKFDHPHGKYAPGRGSYQALPDGNTLVGWTTHALHSEYDKEGNLVMEASMRPKLKSYRSYKFPWVGRPTQPPDVHSAAVAEGNDNVTTMAYVSWNGATEVATWNLYRTNAKGGSKALVDTMPRQGFETALMYEGFASHVVVEALDRHDNPLGESIVVNTIPPSDQLSAQVVDDERWVEQHTSNPLHGLSQGQIIAFVLGFVCSVVACVTVFVSWTFRQSIVRLARSWRSKPVTYERVWEKEEFDDTLVEEGDEGEISEKDKLAFSDAGE